MNKNKFEQIVKIVEDYYRTLEVKVRSKVISGGYQISIGDGTQSNSYINCYNTGTVTYQGVELPRMLLYKLRQVTTGSWLTSEDISEGLVSVHSLSEILSMWERLRKSILEIAPPNLKKQVSEIPIVSFE